jgi:hypothetical protein
MTRKRKSTQWSLWLIIFTLALMLGVATIATIYVPPAHAHSWYPGGCCSNDDCAVVEKMEPLPPQVVARLFGGSAAHAGLGYFSITTRNGTVTVPPNFPRRESKDNRIHACIRVSNGVNKYGDQTEVTPEGTLNLLCLFMPPSS